MKTYRFLAIAPFILIGCGDDSGGGNDTTTTTGDTSDTSNNQCDDNVTPGVSPLTGVNTNVTVTNPNPTNDGCTSASVNNTEGARYPWGGMTVDGRVYTCNGCPGGFPHAQGVYRVHGLSLANGDVCPDTSSNDCNENYSLPDPDDDYTETLWLDGNTFRIHQGGKDATNLVIGGYYFCGMQPEGPNEHVVWVITEATPNTVTGLKVGDMMESGKILGTESNILIYWYEELNSPESTNPPPLEFKYAMYGETDPYGNTASDPFGETPCLE